jgi:hypothetical protein
VGLRGECRNSTPKSESLYVKCSRPEALRWGTTAQRSLFFLGEVFAAQEPTTSDRELAEALKSRLATCMDRDEQGRLQMKVTLPDDQAVGQLALSLERILGGSGQSSTR